MFVTWLKKPPNPNGSLRCPLSRWEPRAPLGPRGRERFPSSGRRRSAGAERLLRGRERSLRGARSLGPWAGKRKDPRLFLLLLLLLILFFLSWILVSPRKKKNQPNQKNQKNQTKNKKYPACFQREGGGGPGKRFSLLHPLRPHLILFCLEKLTHEKISWRVSPPHTRPPWACSI